MATAQTSFYQRHVLPHLMHLSCGSKTVRRQREQVVPLASGRVLEVGVGSGLNMPHYDPARVRMLFALEPSEGMREKARRRVARAPFEVRWLDAPGEQIPLEDASVDTVLTTFTLCTIPDWHAALVQMRRVLRPGGRLLFCEHGESPHERVRRWQHRIDPLWTRLAGGCHVNRPIDAGLAAAGFHIESLRTAYLPGPRVLSYVFRGSAVPAP